MLDPGIRLYGGYVGGTWERDPSPQTDITGADPLDYTIDMAERCTLDSIIVSGFNGVYCGGATGVVIVGCDIGVSNIGITASGSGDPHILLNAISEEACATGIYISENARPTIYGTFIGSSGISSGIRCEDSSTPAILNTTIVDWGVPGGSPADEAGRNGYYMGAYAPEH